MLVTTTMVCLHRYASRHDEHYNIWIERAPRVLSYVPQAGTAYRPDTTVDEYKVQVTYGKAEAKYYSTTTWKFTGSTLGEAARVVEEMVAERERKGYVNVLSRDYRSMLTWEELRSKSAPHDICEFQYSSKVMLVPHATSSPVPKSKAHRRPPVKAPTIAQTISRSRRTLE